MSVYKRGAIYWTAFSVCGQRVRQSTKAKSERQAQEYETQLKAKLLEDYRAAKTGRKPTRAFSEALKRWLDGEAKALRGYAEVIGHARHVMPYTRGLNLEDAPEAAQRMTSAMLAAGLKPATINQRLAIIRRVLNLAFQWGWSETELGRKIKLLRPNNERHLYLTAAEVEALAAAAGEAGDAILLLAYTGLRRGELLRLTEANRIQGRIVLQSNTKSGKPRVVPLPDRVMNLRLPVSVNALGLRRGFEAARVAVGRPDLHLHDLRHTYASMLIQEGAPLAAVSKLLGHAHLGVTSRYTHLTEQNLASAVAVLNRKLGTQK